MRKYINLRTYIARGLIFAFLANILGPFPLVQAQEFRLPAPGVMVHLSPEFTPPVLKGIKVHPDNPFRFDFILDQGDGDTPHLKVESIKLIKYFLASLTIPGKDLWVNLSPYEKDRIIPNSFGLTEMGRDLLAEDYMLKQITASLMYPEDETGRKFWKRIYEAAAKKFGTTDIPVNTFNKVWIVPEKAVVYENAKTGTAYVVESKLKVMLEQDYLALSHSKKIDTNALGSQVIREIVIPELTKEVNDNKNFAQLRQVYNSLILATWYKKKIRDSILDQVYANKSKIKGLSYPARGDIEAIYQRYLQAFKKGVYNYIKDDIDPQTQETTPRKYFSGGTAFDDAAMAHALKFTADPQVLAGSEADHAQVVEVKLDQAIDSQEEAFKAANKWGLDHAKQYVEEDPQDLALQFNIPLEIAEEIFYINKLDISRGLIDLKDDLYLKGIDIQNMLKERPLGQIALEYGVGRETFKRVIAQYNLLKSQEEIIEVEPNGGTDVTKSFTSEGDFNSGFKIENDVIIPYGTPGGFGHRLVGVILISKHQFQGRVWRKFRVINKEGKIKEIFGTWDGKAWSTVKSISWEEYKFMINKYVTKAPGEGIEVTPFFQSGKFNLGFYWVNGISIPSRVPHNFRTSFSKIFLESKESFQDKTWVKLRLIELDNKPHYFMGRWENNQWLVVNGSEWELYKYMNSPEIIEAPDRGFDITKFFWQNGPTKYGLYWVGGVKVPKGTNSAFGVGITKVVVAKKEQFQDRVWVRCRVTQIGNEPRDVMVFFDGKVWLAVEATQWELYKFIADKVSTKAPGAGFDVTKLFSNGFFKFGFYWEDATTIPSDINSGFGTNLDKVLVTGKMEDEQKRLWIEFEVLKTDGIKYYYRGHWDNKDWQLISAKDQAMTVEEAMAEIQDLLKDDKEASDRFSEIMGKGPDNVFLLIAHFIHVPGIKNIITRLNNQNINNGSGIIGELYHAALLQKEGYEILAFGLIRRFGVPGETDILARKDGQFYFVEVKNVTGNRFLLDKGNKLRRIASEFLITSHRYSKFVQYKNFKELASAPQNSWVIQLDFGPQLGAALTKQLIKQLNSKNKPMKIIYSISLAFPGKDLTLEELEGMQNVISGVIMQAGKKSGLDVQVMFRQPEDKAMANFKSGSKQFYFLGLSDRQENIIHALISSDNEIQMMLKLIPDNESILIGLGFGSVGTIRIEEGLKASLAEMISKEINGFVLELNDAWMAYPDREKLGVLRHEFGHMALEYYWEKIRPQNIRNLTKLSAEVIDTHDTMTEVYYQHFYDFAVTRFQLNHGFGGSADMYKEHVAQMSKAFLNKKDTDYFQAIEEYAMYYIAAPLALEYFQEVRTKELRDEFSLLFGIHQEDLPKIHELINKYILPHLLDESWIEPGEFQGIVLEFEKALFREFGHHFIPELDDRAMTAAPRHRKMTLNVNDFDRKILPYLEGSSFQVRKFARMAFSNYGIMSFERDRLQDMRWDNPKRASIEKNRQGAYDTLTKLVESGWEQGAAEALLIRFARSSGSDSDNVFKLVQDFIDTARSKGLSIEQMNIILDQYSSMLRNYPTESLQYSIELIKELGLHGATGEQIYDFFAFMLNATASGSLEMNLSTLIHLIKLYPKTSAEMIFDTVKPLFEKWKWYTFEILYRPERIKAQDRVNFSIDLVHAEAEMVAQMKVTPADLKPYDPSIDDRIDQMIGFLAEHGFQRPVHAVADIIESVLVTAKGRSEKATWNTAEEVLGFTENIMRVRSGEMRPEELTPPPVQEAYIETVSKAISSLIEKERKYKNDPLFYGRAGRRLFPQDYLDLVEGIRKKPAKFSEWLAKLTVDNERYQKVDVKTYKNTSPAEQRLVDMLHDPVQLRLFLKAVTLLRMAFPYDDDFGRGKTPLEYAKEKGLIFTLMDGIRISPATQSFRRHLVGVTGADGVETWFEIKIPGRDEGRDQIFENTMDVAKEYQDAYPEHKDDVAEPIAILTTTGTMDEFYGFPAKFTREEPFRLAVLGYDEGDRLIHLETTVNYDGVFGTNKITIDYNFHERFVPKLFRSDKLEEIESRLKTAQGEEQFQLMMERFRLSEDHSHWTITPEYKAFLQEKSVQVMRIGLRFLELGYRGYNEHSTDWHLENFRLLLSGKVQAVSDFNVFEKNPVPRTEWKAEIEKLMGGVGMYLQGNFDKLYEQALAAHDHEMGRDQAMLGKKGGIDLTSADMNLQTQNSGGEIKFHLDPAMLKQLQNARGFVPVIINIHPMTDLRSFLGLPETAQKVVPVTTFPSG